MAAASKMARNWLFIFRLRPNRVPRVTTLQCDQPQISTLELVAGGLALEISGQIDVGALVSARTISRLPAIGPALNRNWLGRFQHDRQIRNRLALDFRRRTVAKDGDEGRIGLENFAPIDDGHTHGTGVPCATRHDRIGCGPGYN